MGALVRLLLIAVILATAWAFRDSLGDVRGALASAGWSGIAIMATYHPLAICLCGLAWWTLSQEGRASTFILARWIRDGVSELASFLPLAGEMAGARLLTCSGIRTSTAGALTVVDVTAEVMAQFLFSLAGVGLWLIRHPTGEVVRWAMLGIALSIPVLAAFVAVQRSSVMRFLETLPSRLLPKVWSAPDASSGLHAGITALWADHQRVFVAVLLHLSAWTVSAGEAWVALYLLGHPLPLPDVLAMECIIFAIRSAAFFVPAAIGVQEGGYLLLGGVLGLSPEVALAISLLKRGRAIVLGLPALVVWQILESKAARRRVASQDLQAR
ncbi:lysylphosphatidylglycerol synthase domain-containing protein [Telmatospirillum sp.]|uniref:lysylphosphatidylglycerol synthase domain-containing protein n=1 Tax=Telmatospirillum sp. TaxID=2079197 RepID=UPI00284B6503|nr:lysylphosphatidylglycerol synthase domain-containing protein [Telmatospirillum sp.]MDR3441239.1 lysylphosphatidylglycerol synthase domain-containing protein [Telmatospirillum sp.]